VGLIANKIQCVGLYGIVRSDFEEFVDENANVVDDYDFASVG
jgi:hypothetical protein